MRIPVVVQTGNPEGVGSGELLATCAGSGATLVAIVAGFGLTRYLSISSEIEGGRNLVHDLQHRVGLDEAELLAARQDFDRFSFEWDLDDPEVAAVFLAVAENSLGEDALEPLLREELPEFQDVEEEVRTAVVRDWFEEAGVVVRRGEFAAIPVRKTHPSWDEFRRDKALPVEREILWETFYDEITERSRSAAKKDSATKSLTPSFIIEPPTIPTIQMPRVRNWAVASGSRQRRRETAEQAVTSRRAELAVAEDRLNRIAQPKGVVSFLVWLAVVFVLTVVPSMLLLTPEPRSLDRTEGSIVLGLYFVGVVTMFIYFLSIARGVRRRE